MSGRFRLIRTIVWLSVLLLPATSLAGNYRNKHGNQANITLAAPVLNPSTGPIDYTVSYTAVDPDGNKSGSYWIYSEILPGKDSPNSDDFVLNVFVSDDASSRAAHLIFRNNPNKAPLAPIVRLLDCSTDPCTEDKVYDNAEWGAFVIQDNADIGGYPIELLDSRVISQLLEPAQLLMLPNTGDGTGNWAEIMENHRTNIEESRFRMDVDHLGDTQSDLLTSRIIAEIESQTPLTDDDWLTRHSDTRGDCEFSNQQTDPGTGFCIGIRHGELSFLTEHRVLIEDMTTTIFNNHLNAWPSDFTFPFGRMPVWLVDPNRDSDAGSFHVLPTHWERVIGGLPPLNRPGCYHDFPLDAYVPTMGNGTTNLGQYECEPVPTANGFIDRPCIEDDDYSDAGTGGSSLRSDVEGSAYHNDIHPFIGGSFSPPGTTAGTMVFWVFHTNVSTNLLANWRHSQQRDMGTAFLNNPPVCDANGPYEAECTGVTTDVLLDGTGSSDPDGDAITYMWTTDCVGGGFDDNTSPTPTLTLNSPQENCKVTLTVTDEHGASSECETTVSVVDTTPPDITIELNRDTLWPPNHKMVDICAEVTVTDICDPNPTFVLTSVTSDEPDNAPGRGDGNTVNDIQGTEVGTDDEKFQLRSERQGRGDGRKYTITYTAMDASGNEDDAVVCVTVPHDQAGGGLAVLGFEGPGFEDGSTEFTIVIRDAQAGKIDISRTFVGNHQGFYGPTYHSWGDFNEDGVIDLLVRFNTQPALVYAEPDAQVDKDTIEIDESQGPNAIALRYLTRSGEGHLVRDIFKLRRAELDGDGDDRDRVDAAAFSEPGLSTSPDGVKLTLAEGGFVTIDVFSIQGRRVRTLTGRQMSAGTHSLVWNGLNDAGGRVSNGVYFYRLNAPGLTQVLRVVRLR